MNKDFDIADTASPSHGNGYRFEDGANEPLTRNRNSKTWKDLTCRQRVKIIAQAIAGQPTIRDDLDHVDGIFDPSEYADAVSCKPPPLFLPIISLIEVRTV